MKLVKIVNWGLDNWKCILRLQKSGVFRIVQLEERQDELVTKR